MNIPTLLYIGVPLGILQQLSLNYSFTLLNKCSFCYKDKMADDGTAVYDKLPLSIPKAYVFTQNIIEMDLERLQSLSDEYFGSIGVILVDV